MAKKAKSKPTGKAKKTAPKKAAPAKKAGAVKSKAAAKPKTKPAAKAKPAPKAKAKPAPKAAAKPAAKPVASKPAAPVKPVAPVKVAVARPVAHIAKKANVVEDNRTRYSDAELKEFKVLIHKKLDEATRDYELLKNTLSHKDDHGTDDTSPTFKLLEDGSDVLSKEETAHLAARQEKYIQNLKNALIRIENKTYGICRVTGKLIPKERLRSVPHATLSIDAKLGQNR
jgi:RNA polymerase-binding transcription factor DksA